MHHRFSLALVFALTLMSPAHADPESENAWLMRLSNASEAETFGSFEAEALRHAGRRAERRGDTLSLSTGVGQPLILTDAHSCEKLESGSQNRCYKYRFIADLPSRQFYLIEKTYFEGSDLVLISSHDATQTKIDGLPFFNATGDYFLTFVNDLAYGETGRLQIWRVEKGHPLSEWISSAGDNQLTHWTRFESWQDNKITLSFQSVEHPEQHWPAILMHTKDGWQLDTDWPQAE